MAIAYFLPNIIVVEDFFAAFIAAFVLGLINVFIKPILIILTLPINILTLGLFTFIINALLVMLASAIVPGFQVNGFLSALLFSIIISVIVFIFNKIFKK